MEKIEYNKFIGEIIFDYLEKKKSLIKKEIDKVSEYLNILETDLDHNFLTRNNILEEKKDLIKNPIEFIGNIEKDLFLSEDLVREFTNQQFEDYSSVEYRFRYLYSDVLKGIDLYEQSIESMKNFNLKDYIINQDLELLDDGTPMKYDKEKRLIINKKDFIIEK